VTAHARHLERRRLALVAQCQQQRGELVALGDGVVETLQSLRLYTLVARGANMVGRLWNVGRR
jgi:hypothetical protein